MEKKDAKKNWQKSAENFVNSVFILKKSLIFFNFLCFNWNFGIKFRQLAPSSGKLHNNAHFARKPSQNLLILCHSKDHG